MSDTPRTDDYTKLLAQAKILLHACDPLQFTFRIVTDLIAAIRDLEAHVDEQKRLITRLSVRLEIDKAYDGNGHEIQFPNWGSDGISCRDATIRILEQEIARMKAIPTAEPWTGNPVTKDPYYTQHTPSTCSIHRVPNCSICFTFAPRNSDTPSSAS